MAETSQAAVATEAKAFIGERYDEEAGLSYLNARYYDPALGRFIQPDWWEVTEPRVGTNHIRTDGLPTQLSAHSKIGAHNITDRMRNQGLVGDGSGSFKSLTLPNSGGVPIDRMVDAEYKILDNIADMLGDNRTAKGTIDIFTERAACTSCLGVKDDFEKLFPNIKVNIRDNKGDVLAPKKQD